MRGVIGPGPSRRATTRGCLPIPATSADGGAGGLPFDEGKKAGPGDGPEGGVHLRDTAPTAPTGPRTEIDSGIVQFLSRIAGARILGGFGISSRRNRCARWRRLCTRWWWAAPWSARWAAAAIRISRRNGKWKS